MRLKCIEKSIRRFIAVLLFKFVIVFYLGTRRGNFCYGLKGDIGTVDDYMHDVPVNVECDPRQTCGNSINRGLCQREFPSMLKIIVSVM